MVYSIGIVITFFLSFVLLTKKGKSPADHVLLVWLFVILVHLSLFAMIATQGYLKFPYLLGFELALPLLHGPFLFLYTVFLTQNSTFSPKLLLHLIPYILAMAIMAPFLVLGPEEKIAVYLNDGAGYGNQLLLISVLINLSGLVYIILSLRALLRHKRSVKDRFSYTDKVNLQWLFRLVIGLACIWFLVFLADDSIIFTAVVLFVLFIGYYGIKQVGVFTNPATLHFAPQPENLISEPDSDAVPSAKYEASLLDTETLDTMHRELEQLMATEKLYLIPELTLAMVAQKMEIHPNTLSQLINTAEQKNFFDYINMLRIEAFKERLAMPENQKYTLLSLAHECGFNSKTSFNRNFKKATGQSPSEYLNNLQ